MSAEDLFANNALCLSAQPAFLSSDLPRPLAQKEGSKCDERPAPRDLLIEPREATNSATGNPTTANGAAAGDLQAPLASAVKPPALVPSGVFAEDGPPRLSILPPRELLDPPRLRGGPHLAAGSE
jgi:hypothetical protein